MRAENECILCGMKMLRPDVEDESRRVFQFGCRNCGRYEISKPAYDHLVYNPVAATKKGSILSHSICKMHVDGRTPLLDSPGLQSISDNGALPKPSEQFHNLILWLGQNTSGLGDYQLISDETHRATVGALDKTQFLALLEAVVDSPYISSEWRDEGRPSMLGEMAKICLNLDGWEFYYQLKKTSEDSRSAFMAMRFGNQQLDTVYKECFVPAVAKTGFELRKLDEKPSAGIIDVRMEVEIRKSRFVIADITHGNRGVYWEAGFATALGKPVIYTCRSDKTKTKRIHFDVDHRQYFLWDPQRPELAAEDLKTIIRATLPTEAMMQD